MEPEKIMADFADATGLSTDVSPRRYLWTDAFAVCNFIELFFRTHDEYWMKMALVLVDQVHHILGRHRPDDSRLGWISGLTDEEGEKHPTSGGLRIGKALNERKPGEPYDDRMEWDRDGQYYHYLTKWMHSLDAVGRATGNPVFNIRAIELAKAAHAGFVRSSMGGKQMAWKMSIDLSYPLVPSMGLHDPLDGLITFLQLQNTAEVRFTSSGPDLFSEIREMKAMCRGMNWSTHDPLGIGGLLSDSCRIVQLIIRKTPVERDLLEDVLEDVLEAALSGLNWFAEDNPFSLPPDYRPAFRELGLSIGLHAMERIEKALTQNPEIFSGNLSIRPLVAATRRYVEWIEPIEQFWTDPKNRKCTTWIAHQDINSVMLATSLAPGGYLDLDR